MERRELTTIRQALVTSALLTGSGSLIALAPAAEDFFKNMASQLAKIWFIAFRDPKVLELTILKGDCSSEQLMVSFGLTTLGLIGLATSLFLLEKIQIMKKD